MDKLGLSLLLFLATAVGTISVTTAQTCNACNCQFNNVQVLSQLIEAQVNRALADEPLVRMLRIVMNTDQRLQLYATNHSTLLGSDSTQLAQITLTSTAQAATSTNNLLGYRPRFNDAHDSNLAGIFINLEGVFPCLAPLTTYNPICTVFSEEEDGFRGGKALIDSGDSGNSFRIFSSTTNIKTYGIAIQDCQELTTTCFPEYHSLSVACYLPRAACSG